MFSKIGADLIGTADNCRCIPSDRFNSEDRIRSTVLPIETPFIYLKAPKEEHIFTDRAYIQIIGETAASSKRLITRYEYSDYDLSEVKYETGGMGVTDLDCELKFKIGGGVVSIDVSKSDAEMLKLYYKALCVVSIAQARNARLMALSNQSFQKMTVNFSEQSVGLYFSQLHFVRCEETSRRYSPESYCDAFRSVLG